MQSVDRKLSALSRLKSTSVTPVAAQDKPLVRYEQMPVNGTVIPTYLPAHADVDAADWAGHNSESVRSNLAKHGAILFRGFDVRSPSALERFCLAFCGELFADNGEHPRGNLSEHVYTPVFYAPEKRLLWHNENSFNHEWPGLIWFCCAQPAESGGETPLVDSRRVYEGIDKSLREEFVRKGVMYVRNYGGGPGLDWETVFQTRERREVEARCVEEGMSFEWKHGNVLKTSSVRPAAIRHPRTAETSWFNQVQHWHVACLDAETRNAMSSLFEPDDLPRSCCFGDGTPIPDAAMLSVLTVYERLEYSFPWVAGDVLMVDNVLSAHGRNAFSGERRLLVAMGEMTSYRELESPGYPCQR